MKTCEGKLAWIAAAMFCVVWLFACGRENVDGRIPIDSGMQDARIEQDEVSNARTEADGSGANDGSLSVFPDTSAFQPTAHLPGTLLRDTAGGFWMVGRWLDRSRVTSEDMMLRHFDSTMAISMTAAEEHCLPDSGHVWQPPQPWVLYRFSDGELWYVERVRRFRSRATPEAIASWRDNPSAAVHWSEGQETWESEYRDLGDMFLMEGTLLHADSSWYLVYDNATHRFESEELLLQSGYHPDRAIPLPYGCFWDFGSTGPEIREAAFTLCPSARPDPHRYDDEDGDGARAEVDCNDRRSNQHPGLAEVCDGIDNNCDGVIDDGFRVGFTCRMEDGCQTWGMTACDNDGSSVSCQTDEVGCE